ncbi:MAG: alginate lyase family protein [Niastella sp.]|nr:alginate lyase family protein [Niastella sp.]
MKPLLPLLFTAFLLPLLYVSAAAQLPEVYIMDATNLASVKRSVQMKDKATLQKLQPLLQEADKLLEMKPVSVMEKAFTPVSGNKHDYMSQAPYFWYDSSKPNGLPYLRRDGERNPEIYKITDRSNLGKLDGAARTLALAWYFTGKEKYAVKAASLLRTWFFDETTRMNPNLNYGQAIPGINDGRGIGIIETIALTGIADAAGLLYGSKAWSINELRALQQWYSEYLNWMLTSKNGKEEHAAKNNHGTWYYVQVVDFALFTGDTARAHELVEESKKTLNGQLAADGQQPLEVERTNGLGYSTFNLRAWFTLARLADMVDIDLWNYTTPNGAGLRKAVDWLTPYAMGEKNWSWQQIDKYNNEDLYPLLRQAGSLWKVPAYSAQAQQLAKTIKDPVRTLSYSY